MFNRAMDDDLSPRVEENSRRCSEESWRCRRYAHADEIAAMVAYLAGPEAAFVTGAS